VIEDRHGVGAFGAVLGDHVAGVVDDVGVVAGAADHGVGACAAVQRVGRGVAGERVVQRIAGGVDRRRAGERDVLDVRGQRVAHRGLDEVGAFADVLGRHVAGVVDDVGVVAGAADHRVGTRAAIQRVRRGVSGERVVQRVAGGIDRQHAGEREVLDVGSQCIGHRRLDEVGAFAGSLDDHVACVVDDVGVVAGAAGQHVGGAVADQHVVQRVPGAVDRRGAGQREVLDIRGQREGDRRLHAVGAFADVLGDRVAGVVDDVAVVAGTADHRVRTAPAVERVGSAVAGECVAQAHCRWH
jgi:hypothetical protein